MKINTIYIDESGNPKNTEIFIICLIIFTDKYDIDFTVKNIQNFKYIKYENSKNNSLIQLADMCAGCIRCKIEKNNKVDQKLYNLIEKFITYPHNNP